METLRYLNKTINSNERQNFSNWWKELISVYGQDTLYHRNLTSVPTPRLYGESPTANFENPQSLIVLLALNNDSVLLSKFGIIADGDLNGVIHPTMFQEVYEAGAEPKAGDLLSLVEYGSDRLGYPKRGTTIYQLTEVIDEFQINALGGHYVWFFKAKRYDYSEEPNSPGAGMGNTPINQDTVADELSKENFDYNLDNPCSDTSVYGLYTTLSSVPPVSGTGFIYELY